MGSKASEGINLYRTLGYIVCYEEDERCKSLEVYLNYKEV